MRILVIDNKSFGMAPLKEAMSELEWTYKIVETDIRGRRHIADLEEILETQLKQEIYQAVFSFNYYVVIAEVCHRVGIPYISWVYDNPLVSLYSYTMIYDTNFVFLFDYAQYCELKKIGLKQVYYLPLASNTLHTFCKEKNSFINMPIEISFVGSLYNNEKNDLYRKFTGVSSYVQGYLDGLIDVQSKLYGSYILRNNLTEKIISELQKVSPYDEQENREGVESAAYVYADYFLARKVTANERQEALRRLSENHQVYLFSNCKMSENTNIIEAGAIDYYEQMPMLFKHSKINLNITLKSIQTGIPLRILDIMGVGGFLLTNYQSEMEEYFSAGVHYDYYGSMEELEEKAKFYLQQEALREKIAYDGYLKVKEDFNYLSRLKTIKATVFGN